MTFNVFKGGRDAESVAYDLALALASKDPGVKSPQDMIKMVAELLPACRDVAEKTRKDETPKPFTIPDNY
ncbi:hypothetical protein [Morganella sp. GD04133]|uniref:hypothetical protein n=1 Tax=Morganella sp. GD04133 TaxID=2975435 RepID=UPI0024491EF9|nr:hypothetical protein [Morganella sp. GD04133]MDH0357064.1 hypothetical protein [Morganella sp. GD04133]